MPEIKEDYLKYISTIELLRLARENLKYLEIVEKQLPEWKNHIAKVRISKIRVMKVLIVDEMLRIVEERVLENEKNDVAIGTRDASGDLVTDEP